MAVRQTFEFENPEDGEVVTLNVTSLVSDIRDLFLSKIRNDKAKAAWSKMSEKEQSVEIDQAHDMAQKIVHSIASLVATANRPVIHALLDNYKVKGGEVTVTAKGRADDQAVLALNHVGRKSLKIIVVDEEQFSEDGRAVEPDPDQPDMLDGADDEDGPSLADAMHSALEADGAAGGEEPVKQAEPVAQEGESAGDETADNGEQTVSDWAASIVEEQQQEPETADEPHLSGVAEPEGGVDESFPGDQPVTNPRQEGIEARIAGSGPDANPYDGGTPDWHAWRDGYDQTDGQIADSKEAGKQARIDGKGPRANPHKAGTDQHGFWLEGYQAQKATEED